jgi:SAM-dependent methyltransferase
LTFLHFYSNIETSISLRDRRLEDLNDTWRESAGVVFLFISAKKANIICGGRDGVLIMASPEVLNITTVPSYADLGRRAVDPTLMAWQADLNQRHEEVNFVEADPSFHTADSVVQEVREQLASGIDIRFTNPHDEHALDPDTQLAVDEYADKLAEAEDGRDLFLSTPAMAAWGPLTKRAIALHTLYGASKLETLGEGISADVYDQPLFPKADGRTMSAAEIIRAEKAIFPEKGEKIIDSYRTFVDTPIDPESRLFYQGSMDARAVRTRAATATDEVIDHFKNVVPGTKLKSASLACGAAGPVKDLVKTMEQQKGVEFDEVILVDKDPMALASAAALTEDVKDKIRLEHRDLLADPLTSYIEPKSVDVVDLLGLFEYIPNDERRGAWAAALLQNVKEIVKPGGVIVFGNMLDERPQQKFFTDVVNWPRLYQRKVQDVLDVIEQAGFDLSDVRVRIPAKEGVYAVYTIAIPEEGKEAPLNPQTAYHAA